MSCQDFIYWLHKQRINLKRYKMQDNGDLEFEYKHRLMLFPKEMLDNADKWTTQQKKMVLDMIRYPAKKGKKKNGKRKI